MEAHLKAQLFDLADQDREAIARIRERLQLNSSALAVRLAIRDLARRLEEGDNKTPSQEAQK
jgi:DNA-binding transcriptional regulator YiaG